MNIELEQLNEGSLSLIIVNNSFPLIVLKYSHDYYFDMMIGCRQEEGNIDVEQQNG